eukprot:Skav217783  [mRNA]  locus=scaffold1782:234660:238067:- [translate_table: standard]
MVECLAKAAVPTSQLATRQQDSLQAIVNKHIQDPALRELDSSRTSTERGLQRWEQAHLVSALDVLNEYQRSRRARISGRMVLTLETRMCELLKSWLRANAACHSLPEEEAVWIARGRTQDGQKSSEFHEKHRRCRLETESVEGLGAMAAHLRIAIDQWR